MFYSLHLRWLFRPLTGSGPSSFGLFPNENKYCEQVGERYPRVTFRSIKRESKQIDLRVLTYIFSGNWKKDFLNSFFTISSVWTAINILLQKCYNNVAQMFYFSELILYQGGVIHIYKYANPVSLIFFSFFWQIEKLKWRDGLSAKLLLNWCDGTNDKKFSIIICLAYREKYNFHYMQRWLWEKIINFN